MAKKSGGIGCFGALAILVGISFLVQWMSQAWFWIALVVVVVAIIFIAQASAASSRRQLKADLLSQADWLERKASSVIDPESESAIILEPGEVQLFALPQVNLTEWKSTGSSYAGGNLGASFRVASGVSIGVGGSRGQLLRNPATRQITDEGIATFTNKRVIFVGNQRTVEWDLDKMVGVDSGVNGMSVQLAVTNKPNNSGLQSSNLAQITPGIALDIALEYFKNGEATAAAKCSEYAEKLRAAVTEG